MVLRVEYGCAVRWLDEPEGRPFAECRNGRWQIDWLAFIRGLTEHEQDTLKDR